MEAQFDIPFWGNMPERDKKNKYMMLDRMPYCGMVQGRLSEAAVIQLIKDAGIPLLNANSGRGGAIPKFQGLQKGYTLVVAL
jgi:hypothetical protein